jgi:hypothetical protein
VSDGIRHAFHRMSDRPRSVIRRHPGPHPLWPVERIVVATDFSLCSPTALQHAEELARRVAAELLLLHAADVPKRARVDATGRSML